MSTPSPAPRRLIRHLWWVIGLGSLALIRPVLTTGQARPRPAVDRPSSLQDPRLEVIRLASASWELRSGPRRKVVDQVCLVPDLATFFEALATWDEGHFFPILIDDVETTFRFVRAFRPARVVRYPTAAAAIPPAETWTRALDAVAGAWTSADDRGLAGDAVPSRLGATPPGVVFSAPNAPMLAGAVALAAGRFQPLLRLESPRKFADTLNPAEFDAFNRDLTDRVLERIPDCDRLADGCDFLTLAGDYPYRLRGAKPPMALDDAIGRFPGTGLRWAFAGRLMGGPAASVYRAMCSLFLQPESAAMFNGYDQAGPPWSAYAMRGAATRMSALMPTAHFSGDDLGSIDGWHELFRGGNRSGLLLINSSGTPTTFNIRGGQGGTPDVPPGVPAAVFLIHSYSAQNPEDPSTIAGRWLANGAFVYFGSMEEPYLDAFRTPTLVADLLAAGLPMVVAARATLTEPFGHPWRLVYLGDPLYRLAPKGTTPPRLATWAPTDSWPSYAEGPRPDPTADEAGALRWALKSALARLQGGRPGAADLGEVADLLLEIRRPRLPADVRPVYDALLTDVLHGSNRRRELRERLAAIPRGERTPDLRRWLDTILASDLEWAVSKKDFARARAAWADLIRMDVPREWKGVITRRVAGLADTPTRREDWALALRLAIREKSPRPGEADDLVAELKKAEDGR